MKKFKKIAAGLFAAATMATSVACINASAYNYEFSLGYGGSSNTTAHPRDAASYGGVKAKHGASGDLFACFYQEQTNLKVSYSVCVSQTGVKYQSDYYAGTNYENDYMKMTTGYTSLTTDGTYNPYGYSV